MKKLLSVVLAIIIIFSVMPISSVTASAADNTNDFSPFSPLAENNTPTETQDEYIYYSDLFYGYSHYLKSHSLIDHHFQTQMAMSNVFSEYVETPAFGWAGFSETLNLFSSMSDLAKAYTDKFGLTDFQYKDDLDAANKKFAANLFALKMDVGDGISDIGKTSSQLDGVISTIEKLYKAKETDTLVLSESITLVLNDTEVYCKYTSTLIPSLNNYVLDYLGKLSDPLDTASEIFEFAAALATAIAMEDVRMDLIEDIINTQESNSILYEGMTRLRSQLKNGYTSYFVETYFTNKIIDEIAKGVTKNAQKILLGSIGAVCTAVTSCVGLINDIVFDWVLGDTFSTLEDYRETMILSQYSDLLYDSVIKKQAEFSKQFEVSQITEYETLFDAYLSATEYALEQCAELAYYNSNYTRSYANEIINTYCSVYTYQSYINDVKSTIKSIPIDERILTDFKNWMIAENTVFTYGMDRIKRGYMYFACKRFKGNITAKYCTITIPKGKEFVLDGNIALPNYSSNLLIEGTLSVTGNIQIQSGGNSLTMSTPDSVLYAGGHLYFSVSDCCKVTDGTIILNGTEQQNVEYLVANNLIIDNPCGVKYKDHTRVHGHYNPQGNPIDNNGYKTYVYAGTTLESGNDYKDIFVAESMDFVGSIKGNITAKYCTITIPKGKEFVLDGNIALPNYSSNLLIEGTLSVTGNIQIQSGGNSLTMSTPDSVLYAGGHLYFSVSDCCKVTDGTIILNGTKQQNVKYLVAPTIILENTSKEGVVFSSPISPSRLFDHRGKAFTLYNNGKNSQFVDYDGDGLKDNVDPNPTVFDHLYGDVNGDGVVNNKDVTMLRRYLVDGWDVTIDIAAADVNADGSVNNKDMTLLRRYLVDGWNVTLG